MPERTFQSELKEMASDIRGLAVLYGVRPYRVFIEVTTWDGNERSQGAATTTVTEVTEGVDNAPPKVVFAEDFDVSFNGLSAGDVTVGPITPDWDDDLGAIIGGNALSVLSPQPADRNSTVRVILEGPAHPSGAYYRIANTEHHKGYTYTMLLKRSSDGVLS